MRGKVSRDNQGGFVCQGWDALSCRDTRTTLPSAVKICFAGLFDTVSSFGYTLPLNSNNTEDLKLDAVEQAEETVHLASADEHRTFFPTNNKMQLVLNVDHSLQYQFVAINR